jgi:hypothetical protein
LQESIAAHQKSIEEAARGMTLPSQCRHFVLVHGAQHGGWCWFKTQELLEKSGQQVSAIDLVSAGASPVDADDVESFDHHSQPLYDLIECLPNENKVIKWLSLCIIIV